MTIYIDNLDGQGSLDYTKLVQYDQRAVITRELNRPSSCTFVVLQHDGSLPSPVNGARVVITNRSGQFLFTGYVAEPPVEQAAGLSTIDGVRLHTVLVTGDEIVLDAGASPFPMTMLGQSALQSWGTISRLAGENGLPLYFAGNSPTPSRVEIATGSRWSDVASTLASNGRSAYQALNGGVTVIPVGRVTHTVRDDDPGLELKNSVATDFPRFSRDIVVCGKEEPGAYVTEVFQGDGVTASFALTALPFEPSRAQRLMVQELFQGTSINPRLWQLTDPGGHVSLTGGGLTCTGGTGRDGESVVSCIQQLELGGAITLECGAVEIGGGSSGILLGLYAGSVTSANCFLGFIVSTSGATTSIAPLVAGAVAGSSFEPIAGHIYTYRLRLISPEMERIRQTYCYLSGSGAGSVGGASLASPGRVEFEVQDVTSGIPGVVSVLYGGTVTALPPTGVIGIINSGNLSCSIKSMLCTQGGPTAIAVGATEAMAAPQYDAAAVDGGSCKITTGGMVGFYPENIPPLGTFVFARYRARQLAIARRLLDDELETNTVSTWMGSVTDPVPWSSSDCDSAAAALLQMATEEYVALKGTYQVAQLDAGEDIWPGDALEIVDAVGQQKGWAIIRKVDVALTSSVPGVYICKTSFANDGAQALSISLSREISSSAVIPPAASAIENALTSLSELSVESVTGTVLSLNAGATPPANGGFEIRRRDNTFGPGADTDLVLRTATTKISIPRASAIEQYFVRMYDGSSPANYSLQSAAVFVNIPL